MLLATLAMVLNDRFNVFQVYKYGSLDFWQQVNPYSNWTHPFDRYLYGPVFSIFFSGFAVLPSGIGAVLWNITNFSLFFIAAFNLPSEKYSFENKRFVYLFLYPIVLTDLFYFQSNVFVLSLFLLAWSLFEKHKHLYAILLILFSGFSKIYGLIQLGTLLFYNRFRKNIFTVILLSAMFFFVPLLTIPFSELLAYYQSWMEAIQQRHNPLDFEVVYRLLHMLAYSSVVDDIVKIQLVSLLAICLFTLLNYKKFGSFNFRAQVLGIVMGWIILFSTTAEKHTYVIAMGGLVLWYLSGPKTKFDVILLWLNFFLIIMVPIDAIFPKSFMRLLYSQLGLNLVLFSFTWLRMLSFTFFKSAGVLGSS
jgi:hypothetical protein